jgi:hypothetical protein
MMMITSENDSSCTGSTVQVCLQHEKTVVDRSQRRQGQKPRTAVGDDDFLRSCVLSPDGNIVLGWTELGNLSVCGIVDTNNNNDNSSDTVNSSSSSSCGKQLVDYSQFRIGESIYDMSWYPHMTSIDTNTCCFAAVSRDHPVQLFDIAGNLRASYVPRNHLDELDSTYALTFNLAGDKLFTGSNRMIRCFDVLNNNNNNYDSYPTAGTRKSTDGGQKGIITCIEFNPDYSGCYAAGSYAHSVGIYVESQGGECALQLSALEFAVTTLRWSPCGNCLYVGGRKHDDIVCWDVRHTRSEVGRVHRELNTNQRMDFDISPCGRYLFTGNQAGELLVYVTNMAAAGNGASTTKSFELLSRTQVGDCVNAVCAHRPATQGPNEEILLVTSTGQRWFDDLDDEDGSDSEDPPIPAATNNSSVPRTSGLQLWSCSSSVAAASSSEVIASMQE